MKKYTKRPCTFRERIKNEVNKPSTVVAAGVVLAACGSPPVSRAVGLAAWSSGRAGLPGQAHRTRGQEAGRA